MSVRPEVMQPDLGQAGQVLRNARRPIFDRHKGRQIARKSWRCNLALASRSHKIGHRIDQQSALWRILARGCAFLFTHKTRTSHESTPFPNIPPRTGSHARRDRARLPRTSTSQTTATIQPPQDAQGICTLAHVTPSPSHSQSGRAGCPLVLLSDVPSRTNRNTLTAPNRTPPPTFPAAGVFRALEPPNYIRSIRNGGRSRARKI